jgi:uncharacterized protein (DUF1501 family)
MKKIDLHLDRRAFVKAMSAAAATPMMGGMMQAAYAAGPFTDYRATICLFLFGGNDSQNMVIPLGGEYAAYAAGRGNLAIPAANTIPINAGVSGRTFGLHPSMPGLAGIFNTDKKLAIISNVGVLIAPTTLASYNAKTNLPPQLFSHSDMQNHWQSGRADAPPLSGWGGRLADLIESANGNSQVSVSISAAGQSLFQKGNQVVSYAVSPWSGTKSTIVRRLRAYRDWDNYATNRPNPQAAFENQLTVARTNIFEDQWGDMATRALTTGNFVNGVLYNLDANGNPIKDVAGVVSEKFPITPAPPSTYVASNGTTQGNRLAAELRSIASMIAARDTLGVKRQVFYVSIGGFDNHGDQFKDSNNSATPILSGLHSDLLKQVDEALTWFYNWTKAQGLSGNVTTFTMSDFGRTLTSNGTGSDHGWGGHQLVLGGAVNGGAIYGASSTQIFPDIALKSSFDVGQGRLLPWTSVDEYGATFAKWMGASTSELSGIFPNLGRFTARPTGMSFLA